MLSQDMLTENILVVCCHGKGDLQLQSVKAKKN